MKKNFTLTTILSVLLFTIVNAQPKVGIRAGVNSATWQGDAIGSLNNLADFTNGYITTEGRTAFHAGAYVNVPLNRIFSVEPGVYYSQKGYTMKGNLEIKALKFLGANATMQVQSHYIDVPVLLKANVIKGLQVYAGPQLSYLAKNNLNVEAGALGFSVINRDMDITDNFQNLDWALVGGIGYQFNNGFSINAGYDHGLSRLDKNSNFKSYNRVIKLGVGFQF